MARLVVFTARMSGRDRRCAVVLWFDLCLFHACQPTRKCAADERGGRGPEAEIKSGFRVRAAASGKDLLSVSFHIKLVENATGASPGGPGGAVDAADAERKHREAT